MLISGPNSYKYRVVIIVIVLGSKYTVYINIYREL